MITLRSGCEKLYIFRRELSCHTFLATKPFYSFLFLNKYLYDSSILPPSHMRHNNRIIKIIKITTPLKSSYSAKIKQYKQNSMENVIIPYKNSQQIASNELLTFVPLGVFDVVFSSLFVGEDGTLSNKSDKNNRGKVKKSVVNFVPNFTSRLLNG